MVQTLAAALGKPLELVPDQSAPSLDELPAFSMKNGRLQLPGTRLTKKQALAVFLARYPLGFRDDSYLAEERNYKWEAHQLWCKLLGGGEGERLLAAGDTGELGSRVLAVATKTNLLHPNWDKAPLKDALKDHALATPYLRALVELSAAPEPTQAQFEGYIDVLETLPHPGSAVASWPVATIMLYLAQPQRHMIMRPSVSQQAAVRFGFELNYAPRPNWRTYSALQTMSQQLLKELTPLGARDLIDVQSYMWVISRS